MSNEDTKKETGTEVAEKETGTEVATKKTGNDVTSITEAANAFEAYADRVCPKFVEGELLKFSKGDFFAGEKDTPVPLGTRMVAALDALEHGWVRWAEGKPVERQMVLVHGGGKPKKRDELGYDDPITWEVDSAGDPRDPWQFTNYLPMMNEKMKIFTFSTTSDGGASAIGALTRAYAKCLRKGTHAQDFPVVELQSSSYEHKNKEYGRIKFPEFQRVGWIAKKDFYAIVDGEQTTPADSLEEIPY
jgi:hypothetical protein